MKHGDLSIVSSSLQFALKTLRQRWDETSDVWRDSVRQNFEETYLGPLEPQVLHTLKAVNRLSQVFLRARQECADASEL